MNCNICLAPWHPSSGHYISERMRWCYPCTRLWIKELCGMQKRRWGGARFYDYAYPPMLSCQCFACQGKLVPTPLANGGTYTVRKRRISDGTHIYKEWLVIGPYPTYEHICTAYSYDTEEEAKTIAIGLINGIVPEIEN